jgi:hypothetical protein
MQHVEPDTAELRLLAGEPDDVIHRLAVSCACRSDTNTQGDCPPGWHLSRPGQVSCAWRLQRRAPFLDMKCR